MNALGISVFYGADDPDVALAEVRPPVGSKVLIGRFAIERTINLLDLAALSDVFVEGSVFDPAHARMLQMAVFLERLTNRIVMPVMPDDAASDYIPTQAVADYLSSLTEPSIDGIIYPSAQSNKQKRNVILFHKSSRVQEISTSKDSIVTVELRSDEDFEINYEYEIVAIENSEEIKLRKEISDFFPDIDYDFLNEKIDPRLITLALRQDSLLVYEVESIKITASTLPVSYRKYTRSNSTQF